jgi:23S rRNA pseudouridine955/2504/2580 synthase
MRGMAQRLKEMMVFENEHLIVISKDNGVPSQMGTGLSLESRGDFSVDRMLEAYIRVAGYSSTECQGKLVHRLDKKTSGLMVLAKNKEMAAWLSHLLKERGNGEGN